MVLLKAVVVGWPNPIQPIATSNERISHHEPPTNVGVTGPGQSRKRLEVLVFNTNTRVMTIIWPTYYDGETSVLSLKRRPTSAK